jgi:prepilin-type N-terminal cleavage/methylation domain-containing protein
VSKRSGFTLIEVLVSIVLTAVVSLLVYGAVQAARDVDSRLAEEHRSLQSALAMRLLLQSVLAGAQPLFLGSDTVFALEKRTSGRGKPADRLRLITAGELPPLTPGADWLVSLETTRHGLQLAGRPIGVRTPQRTLATLPGITGLRVRVRDSDSGPEWLDQWSFPAVLPQAVELTYWTDSGPVGVPLSVSLPLGKVNSP